jgi:uncharacterized protein (DUF2252 family)
VSQHRHKRSLQCLVLLLGFAAACGEAREDREARIVGTLVRADLPLLRSRPRLVAGKYARMARDLYSFYRGTFALYLRDASEGALPVSESQFALSWPMPLCLGDSHPENVGTLRASDGTFALEPNDFDGADRYPYLWDLRRLTAGLVLAARLSNEGDEDAQEAALEVSAELAALAARAYAEAVTGIAEGQAVGRLDDPTGSPVLVELFGQAHLAAEARQELVDRTRLLNGRRTLLRGPVDPDDPSNVYADLPPFALDALPAALDAWAETLAVQLPPSFRTIKDAARELGTGVASWPRVRAIVLVEGPTGALSDDVLLEVKELADSGAWGWHRPGVFADSVQERVLLVSRSAWARPDADPLWGVSSWLGLPVQVRSESAAHRNLRVRRLEGHAGTPVALRAMAEDLGRLLARVHASEAPGVASPAASIAAGIANRFDEFAEEQARASVQIADRVEADFAIFREALARRGPTLGAPHDAQDVPSPDLRALFTEPDWPAPIEPEEP